MSKICKLISVILAFCIVCSVVPFQVFAASSYTLDVGDTKWLDLDDGGKTLISSLWTSNSSSVVFDNTYTTSAQIRVASYTELQPVIIQCTYYYQIRTGSYLQTLKGVQDYKIYVNNPSCKVTFNANGGSVSGNSSKTVEKGEAYGSLPSAYRTGYNFLGWYTSSSGGSEVTSYSKVTASGDHTLYAHWSGDAVTVNFDPNGGTVDTTSKNVNYDSSYGTLPVPVKDDACFLG